MRSHLFFVAPLAVVCLIATAGRAEEGAAGQALELSKKTGLPILAVAGSKT